MKENPSLRKHTVSFVFHSLVQLRQCVALMVFTFGMNSRKMGPFLLKNKVAANLSADYLCFVFVNNSDLLCFHNSEVHFNSGV